MLVVLLGIVMLVGCSGAPSPVLLPGDPVCVNACKILDAYGCPEAKPSAKGRDCVSVCERIAVVSTQPECVVRSESLAELQACGVECKR